MFHYFTHNKPSSDEKEWLINNYHSQCKKAADAIKNSDMFLLTIGAGFSADSGLAVYKDIADIPAYHKLNLSYYNLCNPKWIIENPGIFYGFWGKCFNDYRNTKPHKGYDIIKSWKDKYFTINNDLSDDIHFPNQFAKKIESIDPKCTKNPFYIYSSNVDSHPITAGFNYNEVKEIHGTIEQWQCSDYNCISRNSPSTRTWDAPKDFKFEINEDTMIAEDIIFDKYDGSEDKIEKAFSSNFPKCPYCNSLARPNILMFGDCTWVGSTKTQGKTYSPWKKLVGNYASSEDRKLVILEIGCGVNVPSVRYQSESVFEYVDSTTVTLIRINPDFPMFHTDYEDKKDNFIGIMAKGLETLEIIDDYINNSD